MDARGAFCPVPLMEMIRSVKSCSLGGVGAIISSDEGSREDIPIWVEKTKPEFLGEVAVTRGYLSLVLPQIKVDKSHFRAY